MSLTLQRSDLTFHAQMYAPSRVFVVTVLSLTLLLGGCSSVGGWVADLFKNRPTPLPPAAELYATGELEMTKKRYEDARLPFRKVVERHPQSSYAPRARFLIGEAYYREGEFDKAIKEFESFLAFFPRHEISDLVQFRLAMSYYDQMKPVEQDQSITAKAGDQFRKLVREYPDSRYASDALSKIEICRGRLAQKELWIASYYINQGNAPAARQRLELVLREYARTLVVPEALYRLADVDTQEGRLQDARGRLERLANEFPYTEWGRRAAQRLRTAAR
ncbi:MAG TPA: outer membrane protein assembly factor BamD [Pseudomonadales bacterium]|nr:outer membrane protein assembly factor BamD [Pseudomonadales bacterium]